ncbi:hypothetical protein [Anabaena sp. UHCC 0399]|uniref:hypothetical protein n=1 Tax=Anabaena sp. UHCC 0399 TaxID=3110238 RepID=UPI002B1F7E02|nr:hypothetical protein [Anabaena sp. UHCC 0399]MEA5567591.1 hypothetical protein [Anabaena sp. UHCC 0399]
MFLLCSLFSSGADATRLRSIPKGTLDLGDGVTARHRRSLNGCYPIAQKLLE